MEQKILGIDIGSVYLGIVEMARDKRIVHSVYLPHHGKVRETLEQQLQGVDFARIAGVVSPSGHEWFSAGVVRADPQVSIIRAAREYFPGVRSVLVVGAEKFMLIKLDEKGGYQGAHYSTSCAAGTGSFLDQQAKRLKLKDSSELSRIAVNNSDELPEIASRCAVFAKTDLIHAQQEGYSLSAICDSLTRGLARNIADTLFREEKPRTPVVFAGGVARNTGVRKHLEELLDVRMAVHPYSHLFAAAGACLTLLDNGDIPKEKITGISGLFALHEKKKEYFFAPLSLKLSGYPDFGREGGEKLRTSRVKHDHPVEMELYGAFSAGKEQEVYLGIDIGSTSTKAALLDREGKMVAGFYTYTLGQPMQATQAILETIDGLAKKKDVSFRFLGVGTTGSGRKFIGRIIGADEAVDEISTHARAAYELDPEVDTIIEIGGQDSKFTLVRNGNVILSQMNSVCAAGTGSFIEEQAQKLGIALKDIPDMVAGARSPLASDRCTVFMERDINHYQNTGFDVPEILSAVLHSVRENYLQKVAVEAAIGDHISFQGATARNKALVAVFEEKLQKKIHVSPYCHLTGAMGTALILKDEGVEKTAFRGLGIYREQIPFTHETCRLCNNHCRITVAEIQGEKVAYGFLCGRDYDTEKYVDNNRSGFDLLKERNKIFRLPPLSVEEKKNKPVVGIPAALHLFDEIPFWRAFFGYLKIPVLTGEKTPDPVKNGKRQAGAEFCSPMYVLHSQTEWLAGKCDYLFIPAYLESRDNRPEREVNYCYYTQFAPSLVALMNEETKEKSLTPLLNFRKGKEQVISRITDTLLPLKGFEFLTGEKIREAWEYAEKIRKAGREKVKILFREHFDNRELSVMFLGRPYLVLEPALNKNIPDIFSGLGIRTFYMDMITAEREGDYELEELLKAMPWHFASKIMESAKAIAETPGLYPVFVTAFKCAPDSFVTEYFKKLMDRYKKPYLILQLDEHDSNTGYETRIEAAIRSFRNHVRGKGDTGRKENTPIVVKPLKDLRARKTLLFPNWDPYAGRLVAANLRRAGYDVRLLEMQEMSIKKSLASNTGQCLPLNIIARDFMDYIEKYHLDPADTALWMIETWLTCNIRTYPYYLKTLFDRHGKGMEKAAVYSGKLTHIELGVNTTYYAYFAYMFAGLLKRMTYHFRPREVKKGETDRVTGKSLDLLEEAFLGKVGFEEALKTVSSWFAGIAIEDKSLPQVAIFGDFFVRDNDVMNQHVVKTIEGAGGEVINTPYTDYTRITAENILRRMSARGSHLEALGYKVLLEGIRFIEKRYYKYFEPFLGPQTPIRPATLEKHLEKYRISKYHSGESYDNILKIYHLIEKYPDLTLLVQTNPSFCCPSLITEAMKETIREDTGIPIITITYDGTSGEKNDIIIPYLKTSFARKKIRPEQKETEKEKKNLFLEKLRQINS